jgi:flagellar protein FlbD
MIRLTRLNHVPIYLNEDLFEHIEVTPDTVITLITKQKFVVLESAEQVVDKIIAFRRDLGEQIVRINPNLVVEPKQNPTE